MGNSHYREEQIEQYRPQINNYSLVYSYSPLSIYRHLYTSEEIMEFKENVYNTNDIDRKIQTFIARHQHLYLVASFFLKLQENNTCITGQYVMRTFYQRVVTNLSKVNDLSFEDSLHCLSVSLKGFQILFRSFGYFEIFQNMFHICQKGRLKVWCNSSIYKSVPEQYLLGPGKQEDMIMSILNIIQQNTCPSSKLTHLKEVILGLNKLTFSNSINSLRSLCRENNYSISQHLESLKHSEQIEKLLDIYMPENKLPKVGALMFDHSKEINQMTNSSSNTYMRSHTNSSHAQKHKTKVLPSDRSRSLENNKRKTENHPNISNDYNQVNAKNKKSNPGFELTLGQYQFPKFQVNAAKNNNSSLSSLSSSRRRLSPRNLVEQNLKVINEQNLDQFRKGNKNDNGLKKRNILQSNKPNNFIQASNSVVRQESHNHDLRDSIIRKIPAYQAVPNTPNFKEMSGSKLNHNQWVYQPVAHLHGNNEQRAISSVNFQQQKPHSVQGRRGNHFQPFQVQQVYIQQKPTLVQYNNSAQQMPHHQQYQIRHSNSVQPIFSNNQQHIQPQQVQFHPPNNQYQPQHVQYQPQHVQPPPNIQRMNVQQLQVASPQHSSLTKSTKNIPSPTFNSFQPIINQQTNAPAFNRVNYHNLPKEQVRTNTNNSNIQIKYVPSSPQKAQDFNRPNELFSLANSRNQSYVPRGSSMPHQMNNNIVRNTNNGQSIRNVGFSNEEVQRQQTPKAISTPKKNDYQKLITLGNMSDDKHMPCFRRQSLDDKMRLPQIESKMILLESFAENKITTQEFLTNQSHALSNIKWERNSNSGRDSVTSAFRKDIQLDNSYKVSQKKTNEQRKQENARRIQQEGTYTDKKLWQHIRSSPKKSNFHDSSKKLDSFESKMMKYDNRYKISDSIKQNKKYESQLFNNIFGQKQQTISINLQQKEKEVTKRHDQISKKYEQMSGHIESDFVGKDRDSYQKYAFKKKYEPHINTINEKWEEENVCSTSNGSKERRNLHSNIDDDILQDMQSQGLGLFLRSK